MFESWFQGTSDADTKIEKPLVPESVPEVESNGLQTAGPGGKAAETDAPVGFDDDQRPIDWAEESRTDLRPRTPERIQYLLTVETEAQTRERIINDKIRFDNRRGLASGPNQQSAIIPAGLKFSKIATFVKR